MTPPPDFAAFILTHGRADHVYTYKTFRKAGYTGPLYLLIDNEDNQAPLYRNLYGDQVIQFDKAAAIQESDPGNNFNDFRSVLYARNACFEIARNLGYTYFMELDDDYTSIGYRFSDSQQAKWRSVHFLDQILTAVLEYYKTIPAKSLAFLQGGDFIGGSAAGNYAAIKTLRKCMNTFILSTERPFKFLGEMNDDVNTYTYYQSLGNLFLSINSVSVGQQETQHNPHGLTDLYLDYGTYVKSFYTVMYQPSSVHVGILNSHFRRLHHIVNWDCTIPQILPDSCRKASQLSFSQDIAIPHRFIRIWLGNKPVPALFDEWWADFKRIHPDYEFLTINDSNIFPVPPSLSSIYQEAQSLAERADIMRILALYEIGGIYVDTDVMPLKSFKPLLLYSSPFIGKRSNSSFETAVIGSPPKHPALLDLIKALPLWNSAHAGQSCSVRTGPGFISSVWFGRSDIRHLPTSAFYPFSGWGGPKREDKLNAFTSPEDFPPEMFAAHLSNHQWGGKPKDSPSTEPTVSHTLERIDG